MSKFDDMLSEIESGVKDLAESQAKDFLTQTKADGAAFVKEIADDLERWTGLLSKKKLTLDEFELLVRSDGDLGRLKALTKAGMAKAKMQTIFDGIVDVIVKAASTLIP